LFFSGAAQGSSRNPGQCLAAAPLKNKPENGVFAINMAPLRGFGPLGLSLESGGGVRVSTRMFHS